MRTLSILALLLLAGVSTAGAQLAARDWTVDGVTRHALVYAPPSASTSPAPVIFAFHGHGGNMRHAAATFVFQRQWPEAITVYMQGLPTPGIYDPEGKSPGWQKTAGDQGDRDLHFFDAVLASLKKDYKMDEKRIYATGHSNGGAFTYQLWAARGDVFAAVAPSAAGAVRIFRDLKPLPVLHVAGRNDERVPFAFQQRVMDAVKRVNDCSADGRPWATSGSLVGMEYESKNGTPFVSVIHPGTHKYPDEAPELITKFFKEHAKT